jgi:hypothetical protein
VKRLLSIAILVAACGGTVVPSTPTANTTPSSAAVDLATSTATPPPTESPAPSPGPVLMPSGVPAPGASPQVVIPAGVVSTQTAEQVAQKMLDAIAVNERKLGRVLTPARIIRIQLLRPGEQYAVRHFDGTNPGGLSLSPDGGPGWMVEAVGTFPYYDRQTGQLTDLGIHGFHEWDDAGGEGFGSIPCWTLTPVDPSQLDGTCS